MDLGIGVLLLRPYCWSPVLGREDSYLRCAAGLHCSPHELPLAIPVPNTHIHTFSPPPACGIGLPSSTLGCWSLLCSHCRPGPRLFTTPVFQNTWVQLVFRPWPWRGVFRQVCRNQGWWPEASWICSSLSTQPYLLASWVRPVPQYALSVESPLGNPKLHYL